MVKWILVGMMWMETPADLCFLGGQPQEGKWSLSFPGAVLQMCSFKPYCLT